MSVVEKDTATLLEQNEVDGFNRLARLVMAAQAGTQLFISRNPARPHDRAILIVADGISESPGSR